LKVAKPLRYLLLGLAALLVAGGAGLVYADETSLSRPSFTKQEIAIERQGVQVLSLMVELAFTPQQQAYGLMFKRSLPAKQGMLFVFERSREEAFWMKHTLIPLDMLFIHDDGRIVKIIASAEPEDLTPILSDMPVKAVLEIGGGQAQALGLKIDDRIRLDQVRPQP